MGFGGILLSFMAFAQALAAFTSSLALIAACLTYDNFLFKSFFTSSNEDEMFKIEDVRKKLEQKRK